MESHIIYSSDSSRVSSSRGPEVADAFGIAIGLAPRPRELRLGVEGSGVEMLVSRCLGSEDRFLLGGFGGEGFGVQGWYQVRG